MRSMITIPPISYLKGNVEVPGSKSISNRILLLSALSRGKTKIVNLSDCQDTEIMLSVLKKIGIKFDLFKRNNFCIIYGNPNCFINCGKTDPTRLSFGNSGISIRFLTAILSISNNNVVLTGTKRMQERPIKQLVSSLKQGNAKIFYEKRYGFVPLKVIGGFHGGEIVLDSHISSQFLSALLIAAPLAPNSTRILVKKRIVSKPYIDMTLSMIRLFKVHIENYHYRLFQVNPNQKYVSPKFYCVEPDMTSASYFLAASAIKGKFIRINGIKKDSIQGDSKFIDIIRKMGANILWKEDYVECRKGELCGINIDANDVPDSAMTIAILALFARGKTIIKNMNHWRFKESNRIISMKDGLIRAGAYVEEKRNRIIIYPPEKFQQSKIRTYNDHRIAMCFSLLSLSNRTVIIDHPGCVNKTFPNFFQKLKEVSYR
ncbi:3-phosphoshikimate 1-carboxyvinyltransferase [Candidatus Riesia pediculicola]|nr:3-phosphoshikimate 1-carboxyvinyltransferase [Candidatus Riesia pediculicola]